MNFLAALCCVWLAGVVGAIEFLPTKVVAPHISTIPPSEDEGNWKYVQIVYKETNHRTMIHTVEPLQPSYQLKYHSTSITTTNNQTISTSSVEFATVLNTTVLYDTEALIIYTYNGAPTYYQTLDFASQRVKYTPISDTTITDAVTVTQSNVLPFV